MPTILILIACLYSHAAHAHLERIASNKSLYEFGVIGGMGYIPDYPASDQGRIRYLVLPQIRYRGLRYRSDEEDTVKARIFTSPLYGFDLSAAGSFPTNSSKNEAREGMPDLDWIGEIGPRFYLYLMRTEKLWVRLFFPIRMAFSTDFTDAIYRGLVLAPSFNARFFFDESKFNSIVFATTRTYTTAQLQEYFFEVDAKYSTPKRAQYKAEAGYLSTSAGLAYIYEKKYLGLYSGLGVVSYKGAANSGSPLHRADYTYGIFMAISYLFYQSEEKGFQ